MDDALIKQTVEIDGLKIQRKYPSDDKLMEYPQENLNRNVYAFNERGELVWTIQEAPHGGENQDKAYMSLVIENGKLIAGNFIGVDYIVKLEDGTVTPQNTNTRPW